MRDIHAGFMDNGQSKVQYRSSKIPPNCLFKGLKALSSEISLPLRIIILTLFVVNGILLLADDILLGIWSARLDSFNLDQYTYLKAYFYLSMVTAFSVLFTDNLFLYLTRKILMRIHRRVIHSLFKNDLHFFSSVAPSRIIYRLTRDQLVVDTDLVSSVCVSLKTFFHITGGILVILGLTFGFYSVLIIVVIGLLFPEVKKVLNTSAKFAQISSSLKSEMYGLLINVLNCSLEMRNSNKIDYFNKKFEKISDNFQNVSSHLNNLSLRQLGIRIGWYTTAQIFGVFIFAIGAIISYPKFYLENIWILSFALVWSSKFKSGFSEFGPAFVSANFRMVSYFRLVEYLDFESDKISDIEQKEPTLGDLIQSTRREFNPHLGSRLVDSQGNARVNYKRKRLKRLQINLQSEALTIKNVTLSFVPHIKVLKNISMRIKSGQRVALLGREGSGRHTLIKFLMKLEERKDYDKNPDSVFRMFGQDIDDLTPQSIRKRVFPLLSRPKLFYGTLRSNINPSGKISDTKIIKALHFMKIMEYKNMQELEYLLNLGILGDYQLSNNYQDEQENPSLLSLEGIIDQGSSEFEEDEDCHFSPVIRTPVGRIHKSMMSTHKAEYITPIKDVSSRNKKGNNNSEFKIEARNQKLFDFNIKRQKTPSSNSNQLGVPLNNLLIEQRKRMSIKVENLFLKKRPSICRTPHQINYRDRRSIKNMSPYKRNDLNQAPLNSSHKKTFQAKNDRRRRKSYRIDLQDPSLPSQKNKTDEEALKHLQDLLEVRVDTAMNNIYNDEADQSGKREYDNYLVPQEDEKYISSLLDKKVSPSSPEALAKLVYIVRGFLQKPSILFLEESAIDFEDIDGLFFFDIFWNYLKKSTIISILSNFDNILRYDSVFVIENGSISETGNPVELLNSKSSKLYQYLKEVDPMLFSSLNLEEKPQIEQAIREVRKRRKTVRKKTRMGTFQQMKKIMGEVTVISEEKLEED